MSHVEDRVANVQIDGQCHCGSIAYEADIVLMLNEKALAVSKSHSAFDPLRAAEFNKQVVLSVDKNRGGPAPVDMEYTKDLAHFRLRPTGAIVEERLVDDLLYPE